jgi:hypothetical protein
MTQNNSEIDIESQSTNHYCDEDLPTQEFPRQGSNLDEPEDEEVDLSEGPDEFEDPDDIFFTDPIREAQDARRVKYQRQLTDLRNEHEAIESQISSYPEAKLIKTIHNIDETIMVVNEELEMHPERTYLIEIGNELLVFKIQYEDYLEEARREIKSTDETLSSTSEASKIVSNDISDKVQARLVAIQVKIVSQIHHQAIIQTPRGLVKTVLVGANVPLKVNQIVLAYEASGQYSILTRLIHGSFDPLYPRDRIQNRRVYYRLNFTDPSWLHVRTIDNKIIEHFESSRLTVDPGTGILYYNGQKIVDDNGYITVVLEQ